MIKFIATALIFSFPLPLLAKSFNARVITVKGKVSKLSPGQQHPSWIKKGEVIVEDSSLLTRKKSFLRLKVLGDNSTITLGPESKLILNKLKKKKGSVVSLLTGTLRASIDKKNNAVKKSEIKFIIKTPSAALGVRGTKLIAVVNNKNKVTSLVTLEGEVAMTKSAALGASEEALKEIQKKLEAPLAVVVKKGRASTSYLHKEELTRPSKVNPIQLIALKKNENLEQASQSKKIKKAKKFVMTEAIKKDLYGENLDNSEEEMSEAPVNGGFVDLKSGIMIPGTDNKRRNLGSINAETGEYIPIKGTKLDPIKGFVAISKNKKDIIRAKAMNKVVAYKELPKNYASGHQLYSQSPIAKEIYLKDSLWQIEVGLHLGESKIINIDKNIKSSFLMEGGLVLSLNYKRPLSLQTAWSFGVRFASYDHEVEEEGISIEGDDIDEDKATLGIRAGVEYMIDKNIIISSHLLYQSEIFLLGFVRSAQEGLMFKQKSLGLKKFELKGQAPLFWRLLGSVSFQSIFSSRGDSIYIEGGKALAAHIKLPFGKKKNHYIKMGIKKSEYQLTDFLYTYTDAQILYGHSF